ncbi:MAG: tryptophan-rich sensory protein [Bacteroidales bacterium]|jgi:hypothetical protein|nr:tryptophan-rich sensory protein [Bacteroidales bacterium]
MIRYVNILLFIAMIVMNYLANALPLNNKTTGQLSDSLPNLFVPAGVTFSIWGIIYLLLLAFCLVQFTASGQAALSQIGWLFGISCLFNALWIVTWHYGRLPLSLIVMLGLLVSLILINIAIREMPFGLIKAAFGIYLGWICIATIANVTGLLVHINWNGFGISEETWTIIMIAAGTLIAAVTVWQLSNPFIGLSVVWAFAGIMIKRQEDYPAIFIAAAVGMAIVAIVLVLGFLRKFLPGLQ